MMAVPFENELGQVRWQPVLPDGRREYEAGWMDPANPGKRNIHIVEDHVLSAPVLYRSERRAVRAEKDKYREEYAARLTKFKEVPR